MCQCSAKHKSVISILCYYLLVAFAMFLINSDIILGLIVKLYDISW